jgi:DNA-binding NarL/FixJ family response regulator
MRSPDYCRRLGAPRQRTSEHLVEHRRDRTSRSFSALSPDVAVSEVVRSLIASGVMGYLGKDAPRTAVAAAIVTVAAGEAAVSAAMLAKLVSTAPALGGGPESPLTPREREMGALAAMGYSNAEIAERLYVSPETVKTHLASIYRKLRVSGRTAAAAELMPHGGTNIPRTGERPCLTRCDTPQMRSAE